MANCNCNDFPISCAPHAPGGDCCHPHGCPPHPHPCPPPPFKGGTSMYIGARYVPIFADPVEWDDEREYEPLTIVIHDGDCYTSKCYVPKGAQLPPYPEGQTKYWVKTSDYNYQFADLKKTVLDLSRLVEQFQKDNERFTELINGWNEKVIQWEKDITAWGERLDTVESNVADLTASLNAEIDRAKAAEQANAAAIAKETTDRQQAISDLDAAYKAADAAEAQARKDGDAANATAIAQETTDRKQAISELDAAYKAADAAEAQARKDGDAALSNRITANKTDIDALKAEQAIQNTNISNNAKNIADNSAEIAKHAARLTSLESNASDWDDAFPDTTIAQEMKKEQAARANADTALNGRCDAIAADVEEVRDLANHKVDTTTYTEGQAAQDTRIDALETGKADKTDLKDWVLTPTYEAGQAAQDAKITAAQTAADKANTNIGEWETDHPGQTISQCATSVENEVAAVDAKADANAANIGDWNEEHPGTTISEECTRLNGKADKITSFDAVISPIFQYSYDSITLPINAGTVAPVYPRVSLSAYINDPNITPNSKVTFKKPFANYRYFAIGSSESGKTLYDITPPETYTGQFNLAVNPPQVIAHNGYIDLNFNLLIDLGVIGATGDITQFAMYFTTDPLFVTVTI